MKKTMVFVVAAFGLVFLLTAARANAAGKKKVDAKMVELSAKCQRQMAAQIGMKGMKEIMSGAPGSEKMTTENYLGVLIGTQAIMLEMLLETREELEKMRASTDVGVN